MAFCWKDFFSLVKSVLTDNQNEIADKLEVHRSTISKLINGKQLRFKRNKEYIYIRLFDPSNSESFAYSQNPRELLKELKAKIVEAGLSDATKNVEDSDYEKYVKGLIQLAKENEPKPSTNKLSEDENTDNIQAFDNPQIDTASAVISYPKDCEMCLCCGNWEGNYLNAIKSVSGSYGKCLLHSKDVLSSNKCNKFTPSYEQIGMYEQHKKLQHCKKLLKLV